MKGEVRTWFKKIKHFQCQNRKIKFESESKQSLLRIAIIKEKFKNGFTCAVNCSIPSLNLNVSADRESEKIY